MEVKFSNVDYVREHKKILSDVSFKVESNSITGIVGASGSGKTTLLNLIRGISPTKGKVVVGNTTISLRNMVDDIDEFRKNIGYVSQTPEGQFTQTTVAHELGGNNEANIKNVLEIVELDCSILVRDPFSLSSGEMRKVALAVALITGPNLLLLDEPTIGLDVLGRKNLIRILSTLKTRHKKTIIVVSHDADFINRIADSVIVIEEGKIVKTGKTLDIFKDIREIEIPKIIEFENYVNDNKGIYLGYRNEINDLVKDILRHTNSKN